MIIVTSSFSFLNVFCQAGVFKFHRRIANAALMYCFHDDKNGTDCNKTFDALQIK